MCGERLGAAKDNDNRSSPPYEGGARGGDERLGTVLPATSSVLQSRIAFSPFPTPSDSPFLRGRETCRWRDLWTVPGLDSSINSLSELV